MKKLPEYTSDDNMFFYMNALVDLVNSQQEAIEKLERVFETQTVPDIMLPATKKPYKIIEMNPSELSQLLDTEQADDKPVSCRKCMTNTHIELCCPKSDTHRTVTLRIPKDKKIGVTTNLTENESFIEIGPFATREEAQKALDEVEHE